MTIGIVVTDAYAQADPDQDTRPLLAALHALGGAQAPAEPVVWHDATRDWSRFDLLVIRTPWDYPQRLVEFRTWLDTVERATTVLNTPATVRWNLDKTYLAQLADAGVAVVPTAYARSRADVRSALREIAAASGPDAHVVLKPTISVGAKDTGLFHADDPAALALAERILTDTATTGGVVMVQPEVPELSRGLEKALHVIDGELTHAVAKGALLARGGGLRGGVYQESPVRVDATEEEATFARDVLHAVGHVTGEPLPLYARIDTVDSAEHGLVLLEAELIEPALNLHVAPEVADVVARAILARA